MIRSKNSKRRYAAYYICYMLHIICLKTGLCIHFVNCKLIFAFISRSIMDTCVLFQSLHVFIMFSSSKFQLQSDSRFYKSQLLNIFLHINNEIYQYHYKICYDFYHTYASLTSYSLFHSNHPCYFSFYIFRVFHSHLFIQKSISRVSY